MKTSVIVIESSENRTFQYRELRAVIFKSATETVY